MSGTKVGGIKARETNYKKHGKDFYMNIGRKGGQNGHTGGFASNRELARRAGTKGGTVSKRGEANKTKELIDKNQDKIKEMIAQKQPARKISEATGIPISTVYKKLKEGIWG